MSKIDLRRLKVGDRVIVRSPLYSGEEHLCRVHLIGQVGTKYISITLKDNGGPWSHVDWLFDGRYSTGDSQYDIISTPDTKYQPEKSTRENKYLKLMGVV